MMRRMTSLVSDSRKSLRRPKPKPLEKTTRTHSAPQLDEQVTDFKHRRSNGGIFDEPMLEEMERRVSITKGEVLAVSSLRPPILAFERSISLPHDRDFAVLMSPIDKNEPVLLPADQSRPRASSTNVRFADDIQRHKRASGTDSDMASPVSNRSSASSYNRESLSTEGHVELRPPSEISAVARPLHRLSTSFS
jgi:hypothetical protein